MNDLFWLLLLAYDFTKKFKILKKKIILKFLLFCKIIKNTHFILEIQKKKIIIRKKKKSQVHSHFLFVFII
jgi:hypothetical protein